MSFTKEQNQAITSREKNLLVSASAGSGKTTVMIERILSLIFEGASLKNMVVCTFTRSAASDMRDKLQNTLLRCVDDGTEFSDVAERELLLLPTAEISTLHSWCQRLIRNYFYIIGADPAFEIADDEEADAMLNAAIDEAVEEKIVGGDADFAEFYDVMLSGRTDYALKKLVKEVYRYSEAQSDPDEWFSDGAMRGLNVPTLCDDVIEEAKTRLKERFLRRAKDLRARTVAVGFKRNFGAIDRLVENIESGCDEPLPTPTGKIPEEFVGLNDEYKALKDAYQKAEKVIVEYASAPAPDERTRTFTRVLLDITTDAKEKYAEEKKRRARLDYSDLEHLTVKLVENPECAAEISERYRYIFVDEYQDINPLQERIISALGGASRFLVGDVKQSIYAFRMCNPNIFLRKYSHYVENNFSKPIELNANFRSAREILDFANRVFSPLMTESFGKIDYAGTAMLTSGAGITGGNVSLNLIVSGGDSPREPGVYSVIGDTGEKQGDAEAETNRVVADIIELLEKGTVNLGNGLTRHVTEGDIAVLSSTRGLRQGLIYSKLKKAGVKVSMSDSFEFASVPEISRLIEFMKYVVFGADDVALAAVLLSPLADFTEDELALVRMTGDPTEKRFFVLCENYAATKTDETSRKLREFFATVERYRGYARTHTACEFVGRLVAEKQWFPRAAAGDDPELKTDALAAFLDHLAASKYGSGVYEYVEYLSSSVAEAERGSAANSVSIMTIHASKGLEFPFVFLVDTAHGFNFTETFGRVMLDGTAGVCMKNFDEEERSVKPNKLTVAAGIRKRRALSEEAMRLLYVAITRPKQGLYVYATVSEKTVTALLNGGAEFEPESGGCFFDWLAPTFPAYGYNVYAACDCVAVGEKSVLPVLSEPDETLVGILNEYYDAPKKNASVHTSVKKSVTAIGKDADDETHNEYITGADDDRALEKGNAYHKAMEKADYSLSAEDAADKLSATEPSFSLVDKREFIVAFEAMKDRIAGRKIYREKQFVHNPGGMLIQGVIDLLITDGKICEIIDYKTSKLSTIESGAYDVQLAAYSLAAEEITGMEVTRASIYSFRGGKFIDADRDKIAAIESRIKSGEI